MNQERFYFLFFLASLLALLLISCGQSESATDTVEVTRVVTETVIEEGETIEEAVVEELTEAAADEAMEQEIPEMEDEEDEIQAVDSEGAIGDLPPTPESGPKVEGTRVAPSQINEPGANPDVRSASEAGTAQEVGAEAGVLAINTADRLAAGALDDNANFNQYLAYLNAFPVADVLPLDVSERHRIVVTDSLNNPLLGAQIEIFADDVLVTVLKTHSDGSVLFFPRAFGPPAVSYRLVITHNSQTLETQITPNGSQFEWPLSWPEAAEKTAVALDILFVLDTTGSMKDELNQLKENIRFISTQIDSLPTDTKVQFGMVTYRDRGEAYLTHQTPFTSDLDRFSTALNAVEAAGGGDYAEDMHAALAVSLNNLTWQAQNRIGLIFLIADASPHLDYGQAYDYLAAIEQANREGIKIFPIGSRGLNDQGAYIFRQLAQMTNGRFIFLTDSVRNGNGDLESNPETGYTVDNLDTLIVDIIRAELNHLSENEG